MVKLFSRRLYLSSKSCVTLVILLNCVSDIRGGNIPYNPPKSLSEPEVPVRFCTADSPSPDHTLFLCRPLSLSYFFFLSLENICLSPLLVFCSVFLNFGIFNFYILFRWPLTFESS